MDQFAALTRLRPGQDHEPAWHLRNNVSQVQKYIVNILTVSCEECDGSASLSSTTCSTNTMNIVLRIVGIIVIQNVSDITDILNERLA